MPKTKIKKRKMDLIYTWKEANTQKVEGVENNTRKMRPTCRLKVKNKPDKYKEMLKSIKNEIKKNVNRLIKMSLQDTLIPAN